jgi:hypothetical protein
VHTKDPDGRLQNHPAAASSPAQRPPSPASGPVQMIQARSCNRESAMSAILRYKPETRAKGAQVSLVAGLEVHFGRGGCPNHISPVNWYEYEYRPPHINIITSLGIPRNTLQPAPPSGIWYSQDPFDFIGKNRQALESPLDSVESR